MKQEMETECGEEQVESVSAFKTQMESLSALWQSVGVIARWGKGVSWRLFNYETLRDEGLAPCDMVMVWVLTDVTG